MPRMIGIRGPKESGKTTAAKQLVKMGYARHRFAGPLKKALMVAFGLSEEQVDGDLKETPTPLLNGRTPRHAMKTMGTEWGRHMIHKDIWVTAWKNTMPKSDLIVVDDIRFPNEIEILRKDYGAKIILITRPGRSFDQSHESEAHEGLHLDYEIVNDGSLEGFNRAVSETIEKISGGE